VIVLKLKFKFAAEAAVNLHLMFIFYVKVIGAVIGQHLFNSPPLYHFQQRCLCGPFPVAVDEAIEPAFPMSFPSIHQRGFRSISSSYEEQY